MYLSREIVGIVFSYVNYRSYDKLYREDIWVGHPESKTGTFRSWYFNGQLLSECTYKDGKLDGIYRKWDSNGKLLTESYRRDNKMVYFKEWDGGNLISSMEVN